MKLYLFTEHLRHAWVAMTERIDRDTSREVQVLSVLDIPHVASLSFLEHRWWADIGRDHVGELLVHEAGGLGV
jgi:hypothetical protein